MYRAFVGAAREVAWDQWSIGDWQGLLYAAMRELPGWAAGLLLARTNAAAVGPPQNLREYDPEWVRAF
jgi:hypothetical protein